MSGGPAGNWRLVLPLREGLPAAYSCAYVVRWLTSAWMDLPDVRLVIGDSGRESVETLDAEMSVLNDCNQLTIRLSS